MVLPSRIVDAPDCAAVDAEFKNYPSATYICYLWATWCVPCKRVGPHVESIALQRAKEAVFLKIDADGCVDFMRKHVIKSIPVIIAFSKGKELGRLYGELPLPETTKFVDQCIKAGR